MMVNSTKKEYDKLSITREIIAREQIVHQFHSTGFLDRNKTIEKIISLQLTDSDMAIATAAKQEQFGTVNLYDSNNSIIVKNIQFQIDFLKLKLKKLELEDRKNG